MPFTSRAKLTMGLWNLQTEDLRIPMGHRWRSAQVPANTLQLALVLLALLGAAAPVPVAAQPSSILGVEKTTASSAASSSVSAGLLLVFRDSFLNGGDLLASWTGRDPCTGWLGVLCSPDGQVIEL